MTRIPERPADYLRAILRAPVYEAAQTTPLDPMPILSERIDNHVLVKREDAQPVHSFKIRGAYTKIRSLSQADRAAGVVTASAGNHAQGVALSGSLLGVRAVVVMPRTTAEIKVEAVRRLGGEVRLHGNSFDEALAYALELVEQENLTWVAPFEDPLVVAGQGTIGLELLQQDARLDRIFVPIGGGGLAAGIAVLVKTLMPEVKVIGVEAAESAGMTASLAAGRPVPLDHVGTFAEGVAVKRVGDLTFRLCRDHLDEVITVDSDSISAAVKDIFEDVRAVAEPAGALALAGLKAYVETHGIRGERLAHILSGANLNFHGLRYISERAELGEHREALIGVTIPEQPGAFLRFCTLLGPRMVTEFSYRAGDPAAARIFVGVRLRRGRAEREEIVAELRAGGYDVVDLSEDELAKVHVRYLIGGRHPAGAEERLFSFEFPESPGALLRFLTVLGTRWNISLFHYRSHGTDYGRVLCAFEGVGGGDGASGAGGAGADGGDELVAHLDALGYAYQDETRTPSYRYFLA